jgi:transcriptional regulator with XRE-family HTH domain
MQAAGEWRIPRCSCRRSATQIDRGEWAGSRSVVCSAGFRQLRRGLYEHAGALAHSPVRTARAATGNRRISGPAHDLRVDLVRFGRGIRALRLRKRWRQVDLATAAGVSQTIVAKIELGRGRRLAIEEYERVAAALDAIFDLLLKWNGEALDRLLDQNHAALVEAIAVRLRAAGWEVRTEVSFAIRGERGSVDVLAWHASTRCVLVIEVKTVVPDVQATLFGLDRKGRLGREIAASVGWHAMSVGRLLVVNGDRTSRRRIDKHSVTFEAALPDRLVSIRRWLRRPVPDAPIRGLMFLSTSSTATTRHRQSGRRAQSERGTGRLPPGNLPTSP